MGLDQIREESTVLNIDIPNLFPTLHKKAEVQQISIDFFSLIKSLSEKNCNSVEFDQNAKEWINMFT